MVAEGLERSPQGKEGSEGNIVTGPWRGPIFRDPAQADFFLPGSEPKKVKATKEGTIKVWQTYKEWKGRGFLVLGFDGNAQYATRDADEALQVSLRRGACVYSFKTRRAYRPVWHPNTPVEQRDICNATYETVEVYGYKSFIEGWDQRPKAKLFIND